MEERKFGWAKEEEDWDYLKQATVRVFSAPRDFVPPTSMNCRNIIQVKNQKQMGSCVGHGSSSGLDYLEFLSNGGLVQFSRMFMYIQAQIASGIRGDNGAAIAGAVKAMINVGDCFESEYPYPSRYQTTITQPQLDSAAKKKILGHVELTSYQDVFDWISQGKGPVVFGFDVTNAYENIQGKVDITPKTLSGRTLGGHCNVFIGYSGEKDSSGKYKIDGLNSWDKAWGDQGWAQWTSDAITTICRNEQGQSSVWGITDVTGFDQARIDRVCDFGEGM